MKLRILLKHLLLFLPLTIIPIVAIGVFSSIYSTQALKESKENEFINLAGQISGELQERIRIVHTNLKILARSEILTAYMTSSSGARNVLGDGLFSTFDSYREEHGIEEIRILDYEGVEIVRSVIEEDNKELFNKFPDESKSPWFKDLREWNVRGGPFQHVFFNPDTGNPALLFAAPLRYAEGGFMPVKGNLSGYLVFTIDVESFAQFVFTLDFGSRGGAFLLDWSNRIIAHREKQFIGKRYSEEHSERFLVNHTVVAGNFLKIVLKADKSDFLGSIYTFQTIVIEVAAVTALAAFFLILFFSFSITRPVSRLQKDIERLSAGDLDHAIEPVSGDEIGFLASAFDEMRISLKQKIHDINEARLEIQDYSKTLEDRVKERTAELKQRQKQLVESEKMAALGTLVAGIAHEINTPVGIGVTASSHLASITKELQSSVENKTMTKNEFKEYMNDAISISDLILKNLSRTGELVKSFKMVATDRTCLDKRRFNVKLYLVDVLLSLRPEIKKTSHNIELICDDEIEIESYPGGLAQVLTNLLLNAFIHAYDKDDKGTITISISLSGENMVMTFSDDGKGISNENIKKIFNPFFTMNRAKGGTGLGLNVVFNMVNNTLNGSIVCNSEEGQGTTFVVTIPVLLK